MESITSPMVPTISAWACASLSLSSLVLPVMDSPVLGVRQSITKVEQPAKHIYKSPLQTNPVTLVKLFKSFFNLNIWIVMVSFNQTVNIMQIFILKGNSINLSFPVLFLTSLSAILDRALAAYILLLWSGCSAWMWRLGLSSQTGRK